MLAQANFCPKKKSLISHCHASWKSYSLSLKFEKEKSQCMPCFFPFFFPFFLFTTENSACTTAGTDVTTDTIQVLSHLGSSSNTKYIAVYTLPIKVPCNVDIAAWDVRYSGPCDLAMQVWTSLNGKTDQFQLFGQNKGTLPDPKIILSDVIGRISVSSPQQIRLTANQTYYFGLTSFGSNCFIDDSSGSYSVSYATGGDLTRSVGNTLTSFSSTEKKKTAYFRTILKGE